MTTERLVPLRPTVGPTADEPTGSVLVARWWPAAWGALLGVVLFAVTWRAMPDDALITLSFARNLVDRGEWAITPGLTVNTATSPLTVWLLAGLYLLAGKQGILATGVLTVACVSGVTLLVHRLGGTVPALLVPALLVTSPLLTGSVGMETLPGVTLLVALVAAAARRRWAVLVPLVAAAPLTRPDLAIGAVAALAVIAAAVGTWRPLAASVGAGMVLCTPWYVFSWYHFGSVWPLTLPVKATQLGWGLDHSMHLANSLPFFFDNTATGTAVVVGGLLAATVGAVVVALTGCWPDCGVPAALVVGGLAEFATLASQATTPIIYYPGILIGAGSAALALVAGRLRWLAVLGTVVVIGGLVWNVVHGGELVAGYHPLRQNEATSSQYQQIAAELPTTEPVMSAGEIGALAYYCLDRGCRVIDGALGDLGGVEVAVTKWRAEHPWAELNYRHLAPVPPTRARCRIALGFRDDPEVPLLRGHLPGDLAVLGGHHDPGVARVLCPRTPAG